MSSYDEFVNAEIYHFHSQIDITARARQKLDGYNSILQWIIAISGLQQLESPQTLRQGAFPDPTAHHCCRDGDDVLYCE